MYSNLVALASVVFGMAMSTTVVKGQVLIDNTNQVWKYLQPDTDPGAFQDPLFVDDLWPQGNAILAFENSTGVAALDANVYPNTNTVLLAPGAAPGAPNHTVDYFRTHFTFSGAGNVDHWVLTLSNQVDDGYVAYLNGAEVDRYNMNPANDQLAAAANPGGEGVYVVRNLCIPSGTLVVGDNVLAVRVHQNAGTSSDVVWGTSLHASLGSAPAVTSPTAQVNMLVRQGANTNLTCVVQLAPCGTLQWYKDGAPIDGATAATYSIVDMDDTKDGTYFLRAVNALGSIDSPNFVVTFDADVTAPEVLSASASVVDLTLITVVFSEDVSDVFTPPFDPITFYIENREQPGANIIGVSSVGYASATASNVAIVGLAEPRDPAIRYQLVIITHAIEDRYGNRMADPTVAPITVPTVIQEGLNGYAGTEDTEVRFSAPDSAAGGALATVNCDGSDGAPAGPVHSFVRFNNLIGNGPNQIPSGAMVSSATLRIWTDDQGSSPARVMRMLVNWDETSTWNGMVTGNNETNGVESVQIATLNSSDEGTPRLFDDVNVTAVVQDWANGAVNYGFGFLPVGNDGWRWVTSENGTAGDRPMLIVAFAVQRAPCNIEDQPDTVTVNEKQPFSLTVVSSGSDLNYQWYFDPAGGPATFSPITGANAATYSVNRAIPANSGDYRVVVQNAIPSVCTSLTATVTVNADLVGPALTSAVGNRDQTTITLTFNDTLNATTAGNPSTYTLNPSIGISSVGINGTTVTLTQTVARVVGQNYTLTITGLRDDAVNQNLIVPNPTVTNLAQQIVLAAFNSIVWKYETNGTDLGNNGVPWAQPGYNDSAWPSAGALLGFEPGQATLDSLFAQGLNTNNAMLWPLDLITATTTNRIITYYVRTSVNIPYDVANATITLRQVIDDGSVYYFNGTERFRFDMPAGDDTYLTEAGTATGEAVIRSANLTNIACGPNLIAVSIHNDSPTSSDILFAAELLGTFQSFGICSTATLFIVNNGNGTVTLSWTGSGTLQESTDLTNWAPSANQNNPQTFTPTTGRKFYRVQ